MRSAGALRIISGILILICKLGKSADFPNLPFHRRGRGGELHLQHRFLRKRGAAARFFWLSITPSGAARQLPQGDAKPSQALPRQLSRRESQGLRLVAKVLGIMRKLPAVLLALPLGELAKP